MREGGQEVFRRLLKFTSKCFRMWRPETLPNCRSQSAVRTRNSQKMGTIRRKFGACSRTSSKSCPHSCPHRSTVAYFGPCCLDGTSKTTATRGSRLRSELDFRGGAEIHGRISKQQWITVAIQTPRRDWRATSPRHGFPSHQPFAALLNR